MSSVSDGRRTRLLALQRLAIDTGRKDFEERHPGLSLSPVAALVCAYEEEDNLGAVLGRVPEKACGLDVTPVVVVDGGHDATDRVAKEAGAVTFVFPTNLGHGVALRVGYDLCVAGGARYVVTLDADGQNDPGEIETMLQPLVDDEADFVVASRRLGVDETADSYRKLGVKWFSWLMNLLMGSSLTDTSNGYRALRATMVADVVPRLEQDQYQTAELLITAMSRGWRVTERPTVWHERTSGTSKKGGNLLYGFRYAAVVLSTWRRERGLGGGVGLGRAVLGRLGRRVGGALGGGGGGGGGRGRGFVSGIGRRLGGGIGRRLGGGGGGTFGAGGGFSARG